MERLINQGSVRMERRSTLSVPPLETSDLIFLFKKGIAISFQYLYIIPLFPVLGLLIEET